MPAPSLAHARATEALYLQHHSWLVARLKRKLGCAWDAADLAQNTFVRVLAANTDRLGELAEPRAYLTTTAKRLLIDRGRRQQIEDAYLRELALTADALSAAGFQSPEQILTTLEALEQIAFVLDGLQVFHNLHRSAGSDGVIDQFRLGHRPRCIT